MEARALVVAGLAVLAAIVPAAPRTPRAGTAAPARRLRPGRQVVSPATNSVGMPASAHSLKPPRL